jgi:hypothetical protein
LIPKNELYPEVLESYDVSCDTAAPIEKRVDELENAEYGLWQDCYWAHEKCWMQAVVIGFGVPIVQVGIWIEVMPVSKRNRRIAIVVIVVLVAMCVVVRLLYPRLQLTGRSVIMLAAAIQLYIDETGEMPSGFADLQTRGIIHRCSEGYQIEHPKLSKTTLFYLDEISVNWDVQIGELEVKGSKLVSKTTQEPKCIIRTESWYVPNDNARNCSIAIYESLVEANARVTGPGMGKAETSPSVNGPSPFEP